QVTKIYGALQGLRGILNEEFVDLTYETNNNLEKVANTSAAALFSTRDKPDELYCKKVFRVLKAHDVRFFFYIGGNDSSDTVRIVTELAAKENYEFRAVHIPKTIDNDLVLNDHTPGFGSAAKFVAQAFMGANLDNRSLPGIYIGVVMGRHAGFLTAASALARKYPEDGPHLIYLPERAFDKDKFLVDVQNIYNKYGRCVIAVSEGIQDKNGTAIIASLVENVEKDDHGNVQLSGTGMLGDVLVKYIKDNLEVSRVRADTYGYLQRSFMGCVSEIDQKEAREVGEMAVKFAVVQNKDGSVSTKRDGNYSVKFELLNISAVAGKTKHMADEFINDAGNNVTKKFIDYCLPLVGKNLAEAAHLLSPKVEKILHK
ncbi:MAG: 6-phosphofructokinase, partial [Candidatus Cloacimonadota bacterium]|nr:6-phosphofructokinase [Candidatus Cloacimonadota bacterium]